MSYAIPGIYDEAPAIDTPVARELIFVPRSKNHWIAFIIPMILCGISWAGGGIPQLTDFGFLSFTIVCAVFMTIEFVRFPRRFGIGGLVLYGGTLCWFCEDYMANWFNHDFISSVSPIPAWVIAKTAFLYVLFVMLMSISLNWKFGRPVERLLLIIPEPGNNLFYVFIVLFLFCFSMCPYVLFNAEPWYLCTYHALFAGWVGPPLLTVFRTGNLNYSWGAYVAQIMGIGEVGGIVAIMYAIMIARTWPGRLLGIFVWTFNVLISFASGRRGYIAFDALPPVAMLFIKYQAQTAMLFKKFSIRAYLVCGLLTVAMQFVIQFQGTFRGGGYANADVSTLELTKVQGNTMFSEGLKAYAMVGVTVPFFYANSEAEGALIAMPQTLFDLVIGPVPRALWHDKPYDKLWAWYNKEFTGAGNGLEGTTISHGLIGTWYFKYGLGGMIEGALLVGWLMGISERTLQHSEGKPMNIMMALAFATWIFRCFRDFGFQDLYGLMIGAIVLSITIRLLRPLLGGGNASLPQPL